jgi:signal transduction histidine kinase
MIIGNLLRALVLITIFLIGFISTTILAFEFDEKAKRCLEAHVELKNFESTAYLIEESILLQGESNNQQNAHFMNVLLRNLEFLELHSQNWSANDWSYIIPDQNEEFLLLSDSIIAPIRSLGIASEAIIKNQKLSLSNLSLQLTINSAQRDAQEILDKSTRLQLIVYDYYNHWNKQKALFWIISSVVAVCGLVLIVVLIVYPKERALYLSKNKLQSSEEHTKTIEEQLEKALSTKHQIEGQLKENQRLLKIANYSLSSRTEEVQQAKVDLQAFVYIVYHQLNQPIKGIRLLLSRIQEQNKTASREMVQQSVDLAYSRNAQLGSSIDLLKEFGLELNKESEFELVYLNQLIAETLSSLKPKELVKLNIQDNLPSVRAPLFTLKFVLNTLLENALHFNDSDSPEISVKYTLQTHKHCIEITDNGSIIAKENQDHLFDLFFSTKSSAGTEIVGMGLPMSKYLIERFGGSITFRSNNSGNIFEFCWPVKS